MRRTFARRLQKEMRSNPRLWVLTADLGYGMFDELREEFPTRFTNVGSAEQLLIGVGVGLAYRGYIPICYSITPFLLARPFEMLRNYINHESVPVKLVGSGRDREYLHDGFTHAAEDAKAILNLFPNIAQHWPKDLDELEACAQKFLYSDGPAFLSLSKRIYSA